MTASQPTARRQRHDEHEFGDGSGRRYATDLVGQTFCEPQIAVRPSRNVRWQKAYVTAGEGDGEPRTNTIQQIASKSTNAIAMKRRFLICCGLGKIPVHPQYWLHM